MAAASIAPTITDADHAALSAVQGAAHEIAAVLSTARCLIAGGHWIDLAGIDDMAGKVCAKALDLPPAFGRQAVPALTALRVELDTLGAALEVAAASSLQGKRPVPCTQNRQPASPR